MATNQEEYDEWNDAGEEDEGPDMMIIGGAVVVGILVIFGLSYYMEWCCFGEKKKDTPDPTGNTAPEDPAKKLEKLLEKWQKEFKDTNKPTNELLKKCNHHISWVIFKEHKHEKPADGKKTKADDDKTKADDDTKAADDKTKTADDKTKTDDNKTKVDEKEKPEEEHKRTEHLAELKAFGISDLTDDLAEKLLKGDFECCRYAEAEIFEKSFLGFVKPLVDDKKFTEEEAKAVIKDQLKNDKTFILNIEFEKDDKIKTAHELNPKKLTIDQKTGRLSATE